MFNHNRHVGVKMSAPHRSFDEDKAEFQKLHETPTCFVIIGKPVMNHNL